MLLGSFKNGNLSQNNNNHNQKCENRFKNLIHK